MKALARATVFAMAFIELCGDATLPTDVAADLLSSLADYLQDCTPEERAALREVLKEFEVEDSDPNCPRHPRERKRRVDFFRQFMHVFRLDDLDTTTEPGA